MPTTTLQFSSNRFFLSLVIKTWANEIAQWENAPAAKHDNPGINPGDPHGEKKDTFQQVVFVSPHVYYSMHTHMHTPNKEVAFKNELSMNSNRHSQTEGSQEGLNPTQRTTAAKESWEWKKQSSPGKSTPTVIQYQRVSPEKALSVHMCVMTINKKRRLWVWKEQGEIYENV